MQEYDSIRPFYDHEVPGVVARVVSNPEFGKAASKLVMPACLQGTRLGDWLTSFVLRRKTRQLSTVADCQLFIADYFQRLVDETIVELTVSGLQDLDPKQPYLYMSNHRDIVMDSGLLNFLLHNAGFETCRMAVGDNLLTHELAADLMRLNKSFVVERSISGARATLNALTRTSNYIRHSLDEGVSIWIAQREGRAKDGWDRTDPALLKMLALAYKEDEEPIYGLVDKAQIVPVSISYEIDPCALRKAHELYVVDRDGAYAKSAEEDLQSIVTGIVGHKGRVHLHFSPPLTASVDNPEALATIIDQQIMAGMRVFPTHVAAANALGDRSVERADVMAEEAVMARFEAQLNAAPEQERAFVLLQYANLLRNRRALGIVPR
jgi:1-acyl-sn-glycerol-3-phosphate acyltransferase